MYSDLRISPETKVFAANEKAARQQGDLFFSRENSSNGGCKFRQNFLPKSYGPKKQGVKQFLSNKCLYFQQLT
jgi:hypothetical protein